MLGGYRETVSGRYRVGMDGLDGDKRNHTSGCKGQHTLADFSPMHGAYSPIWRAEATENPSLDDGPGIRAGVRDRKKGRAPVPPTVVGTVLLSEKWTTLRVANMDRTY